MKPEYYYHTSCVNANGQDISDMVDRSREISYKTFIGIIGTKQVKRLFPYYSWNGNGGLKMKDDFAVSFHKSKYRGELCYYIDHSAIEYIFIQEN